MQPTLVAAVLAVFAGVSYAALAADDKAPAAQTDAAQTASKKADTSTKTTTPKKKVTPHSHVQEKHGGPSPVTTAKADADKTLDATANRRAHFHPRDGK